MSRVVFFGSPEAATPSLRAVAAAGHDIAAVYTRRDRPAGRSKIPVPTPVRVAASEMGLSVATLESLRSPEVQAGLAALEADAFLVVAYGRLLPPGILQIPHLGVLNLHPSLLPAYRGPSPVATAILDGAQVTGVTVMLLDEGMDTGPLLARSDPVPIDEADTQATLTSRLFQEGAGLLVETLARLERGEIEPRPQDESLASVTRLLKRADGEIDWSRPAAEIVRKVRAFDPFPGTFTWWSGRSVKILAARADPAYEGGPGLATVSAGRLLVAAGDGSVEVTRVQMEGRQAVSAADFVRGYGGISGARLGT